MWGGCFGNGDKVSGPRFRRFRFLPISSPIFQVQVPKSVPEGPDSASQNSRVCPKLRICALSRLCMTRVRLRETQGGNCGKKTLNKIIVRG